MTGAAYRRSAELAERFGAFPDFELTRIRGEGVVELPPDRPGGRERGSVAQP